MSPAIDDAPDDWSAGTYDGAAAAQLRALAGLSPADRLDWLDEALDLALRSGALARARAERHRLADDMWTSA